MEQLLGAIPQLVDVVNKGGVTAVLLIVCGVMGWEILRLRKQAAKTFVERDAYRNRYILYKAECDRANLKVDTSALEPLPELAHAGATT